MTRGRRPRHSLGSDPRRLLLLAPSRGFGGGIERVAAAVEEGWEGPINRIDLYDRRETDTAAGQAAAKARFTARAVRSAVRERPQVVLCLLTGLLPAAHLAGVAGGARVAIMGIGLEVWGPMPRVERVALQRCSRTLAISSYTADWLARRSGIPRQRISILGLPAGRSFEEAAAAGAAGSGDGRTLLTVSRIVPEHRYKGHFQVAEAMPAVLERVPDARWRVIGSGEDLPALAVRCDELGIADAVDLRGSVDEAGLHEAYRAADLFVLPSVADPHAQPPEGEGFGLVYAEAAAYGVPSVASSAGGGALDFVEHGVTGVTVAPGDATALARVVAGLLEDPDRRRQLGEAARRRLLERHRAEDFATALRTALS